MKYCDVHETGGCDDKVAYYCKCNSCGINRPIYYFNYKIQYNNINEDVFIKVCSKKCYDNERDIKFMHIK